MIVLSVDGYGALFLSISTLIHVLSNSVLKFFGEQQALSAWQWLYLKSAAGLLLTAAYLVAKGRARSIFPKQRAQVIRGFFGLLGNWLWIKGIFLTPLYVASILSLTSTFFTTLGAIVFLKERPAQRECLLSGLSLLGAILTIHFPGGAGPVVPTEIYWVGIFYLLGSAACFSICSLLIKGISQEEDGWESLCILLSILCLGSLPGAIGSWESPTQATLLAAVFLGGAYVISQQFLFKAYALARASFIAPFKVLRIPFSVLASGLLFGELPDLRSALGCFVIFVAHFFLFRTRGST